MSEVSTIGLDIAKSVFQLHGVDVDGAVVIRKRISRAKLLEFFASLRPASSALRRVRPQIIGAVGFRRSATR
jgi:transposase